MAIGTVYSDALESQVGASNIQAAANLSRSKVVVAPFLWTCASEASGTVVNLAKLPKGARILTAEIVASAALANSAQISIGLSGVDGNGYYEDATAAALKLDGSAVTIGTPVADSAAGLKAAAIQSTTKVGFALTTALGFLYETTKEVYVTATTSVGTIATEVVRGYITYAID
jgi:hypothetical protein